MQIYDFGFIRLFEILYCKMNKAWLLVSVIVLLIVLNIQSASTFTTLYVDGEKTSLNSVRMPYQEIAPGDTSEIVLLLNLATWGPLNYRVIPDDQLLALSIQNQPVELSQFADENQLKDWSQGFILALDPKYRGEYVSLKFKIYNSGGAGGINLYPDAQSYGYKGFKGLQYALLLFAFALILSCLNFSSTTVILHLLGLVVLISYWSYTPFYTRTYDVIQGGGHLDYIEYLITHHQLPHPGEGWEYHQPPLYYLLASVVYLISQYALFSDPILALQFFSLGLYLGFLIYGSKTIDYLFAHSRIRYYLQAALIFWPAGIIHSIRIGNDLLLYLFGMIAFYFLVLWWNKGSKSYFLAAGLFSALSVTVKSNGFIMVALLMSYWFIKLLVQKKWQKGTIRVMFMNLIAFLVNLGDNIYYAFTGENGDWLMGNVTSNLASGLMVENKPWNYLYFDLKTFLNHPFISTWTDEGGRQYFWNFLLKSSLFGEFSFHNKFSDLLAMCASLALLVLIGYVVYLVFTFHIKSWYRYFPVLMHGVLALIFLVSYRIKIPASCNTDYRYIYPTLLSLLLLYGLFYRSIEHRQVNLLHLCWYMPMILIPASGIALMVASN